MSFSQSSLVSGMVLECKFKSQVCFELTFVYVWWSILILMHVAIQLSQYQLLKSLSFPHYIFLAPLL